eukprot:UN25668
MPITFEDAVKRLNTMFPDLPQVTIENALIKKNGHVDKAIASLMRLTNRNQNKPNPKTFRKAQSNGFVQQQPQPNFNQRMGGYPPMYRHTTQNLMQRHQSSGMLMHRSPSGRLVRHSSGRLLQPRIKSNQLMPRHRSTNLLVPQQQPTPMRQSSGQLLTAGGSLQRTSTTPMLTPNGGRHQTLQQPHPVGKLQKSLTTQLIEQSTHEKLPKPRKISSRNRIIEVDSWYEVLLKTPLRMEAKTNSEVIQLLPVGLVVHVVEVKGRRCRLDNPVKGWCSAWSSVDDQILQKVKQLERVATDDPV